MKSNKKLKRILINKENLSYKSHGSQSHIMSKRRGSGVVPVQKHRVLYRKEDEKQTALTRFKFVCCYYKLNSPTKVTESLQWNYFTPRATFVYNRKPCSIRSSMVLLCCCAEYCIYSTEKILNTTNKPARIKVPQHRAKTIFLPFSHKDGKGGNRRRKGDRSRARKEK